MSSTKYSDLEKNVKFKSQFVSKSILPKNFVYLLAPIILLVFSVFSILYIFEAGRLASIVTLPYALIFILGVVFLRLSRIYIIKKEVSRRGHYLVCLGKIIKEDGNYAYVLFSKDEKRHDKHFIERVAKQLNIDTLPVLDIKDETHYIDLSENGGQLGLKVLNKKEVNNQDIAKEGESVFLLEYIDDKNILPISNKKMRKSK